jgi:hypothetical protein
VYKKVAERVGRGELIAEICSVFGEVMQQIFSPTDQDTVIVGLEANPVAKTGNRIVSRIFLLALITLTHSLPGSSGCDRGGLSRRSMRWSSLRALED